MHKVLAVVGSRGFQDYELMKKELSTLTFDEMDSGGADGTDKLAERYAKEFNIPIKIFKADWDLIGKAAGMIRNRLIVDYCHTGIAFWDGRSRGTAHAIKCFEEFNRPHKIVRFNGSN